MNSHMPGEGRPAGDITVPDDGRILPCLSILLDEKVYGRWHGSYIRNEACLIMETELCPRKLSPRGGLIAWN